MTSLAAIPSQQEYIFHHAGPGILLEEQEIGLVFIYDASVIHALVSGRELLPASVSGVFEYMLLFFVVTFLFLSFHDDYPSLKKEEQCKGSFKN